MVSICMLNQYVGHIGSRSRSIYKKNISHLIKSLESTLYLNQTGCILSGENSEPICPQILFKLSENDPVKKD